MAKKDKHLWNIETSDGKHIIRVNMASSSREPIEILVDDRSVATVQYSGRGLIPQMEYNFPCGDETVMFVLHGSDIDMVHRGKLVKNKIEYKPQEKVPIAFRIIIMLLAFSAIAEIPLFIHLGAEPLLGTTYVLPIALIISSTLLSFVNMISPFKSKNKKMMLGVFFVFWSWIMTFLILFLLSSNLYEMI